jgi:alkylation response protein AidB-like acyl-CoA dehydrogenase
MDLTFNERETAFRDELRAWLADNHPGEPPTERGEDGVYGWRRDWQRRLYDAGWAAPNWPREYGGRGASLTEQAIYFEELGRARAPLAANVLGLLLGAPRSRSAATSSRSSAPTRSGARASPSPTPARTSPR